MATKNTTTAAKPAPQVAPTTASDDIPHLPAPVARRGIDEFQWRTLANNLYPGARPESVLMVWDYCRARKLDPLKKPCHIVPMRVTDAKTGEESWRDVILPGIYEIRTTAQRTGEYLGHSKPEYGPVVDFAGVKAPEWCELTVYRWNAIADRQVEFPVRVYFSEVVATKSDGKANARWKRSPVQMLTKCTEAAGLREAFPDEIGGEQTAEEMDGQVVYTQHQESAGKPATAPPRAAAASAPAPANGVQLDEIRRGLDKHGLPENELLAHLEVDTLDAITFEQMPIALEWIASRAP